MEYAMDTDRLIVLDTETTGLEVAQGHRIIEIGCVELCSRRITSNQFHHYINPERTIDAGAAQVHGIDSELLRSKPRFSEVAEQFLEFIGGAQLVIHNAPFDVGFLDAELERAGRVERIADLCAVTDTLLLARKLHPGARASLDALCKRYSVDNSNRELHGALLDARLLAEVYLAMTGGQSALQLEHDDTGLHSSGMLRLARELGEAAIRRPIVVIRANTEELEAHQKKLREIEKKSGCLLWSRLDRPEGTETDNTSSHEAQ